VPADSYFDFARYYDPLFGGVFRGLRAVVGRMAAPKSGMRVLDVGCGTGAQLAILQQVGCQVFGIDLSEPMLRVARSKLGDQAVLIHGDATRTPFPDHAFDLVLCSLFLHQLKVCVRSLALEEAQRVVRKDGRILLVDFHPEPARSIGGRLTEFVVSSVEFLAGWEHYSNSRDFLSRGGVSALVSNHHLMIQKEFILWRGNLGIYSLKLPG
jgi:ubiquinone/menaquinone biosynthesis C-methylase UbiE